MALEVLKFERGHYGDPEWLTEELLTCYAQAVSAQPEIIHADPLVRTRLVYALLAGWRFMKERAPADIERRVKLITLMQQDFEATQGRLKAGGW